MKKRKPQRMKTYRTWQVVDKDGRPVYPAEMKGTTKSQVEQWLIGDEQIIKVEVREIE